MTAPTTTVDDGEVPTPRQAPPGARAAALVVFALWIAVAVPIILFVVGSYYWFFLDDFSLLTGSNVTSAHDLFAPHAHAHWSTLPTIAWHAMYSVFGLRSYRPYQFAVVALHLTVCVLLRVIMRRVGVAPWIATAAAGSFILFGPGQQNILWAFQIGFTGSLVFGLAQLVLADHDGPINRRDLSGVGFGLLALMSSGVGVTTALVVGIATFVRRGWLAALANVAPLAAAYLLWAAIEHPQVSARRRPGPNVLFEWVKSAETGVFTGLGRFTVVAVLLGITFVAGLVLAWSRLPLAELRRRAAMPAAMLIGGVAFSVSTAMGRWYGGPQAARSSRYLYIGVALALPALAVAADAIARRWRVLTIPVIVLLLFAVPWNSSNFDNGVFGPDYMDQTRRVLTNVVRLPEAHQVPRNTRPITNPFMPQGVDIGFLLGARADGKLDVPTDPLAPEFANELRIRLGVDQRPGPLTDCKRVDGPLDITPAKGTVIGIYLPITITTLSHGRPTSRPIPFRTIDGTVLTIQLSGLDLRLAPPAGADFMALCKKAP